MAGKIPVCSIIYKAIIGGQPTRDAGARKRGVRAGGARVYMRGVRVGPKPSVMTSSVAALFKTLTQGVYVIGVAHGGERNAFTAAWVMQVSFDPLLLCLSINPDHSSYRLLQESGAFSVNVLKQGQLDVAARFGDPKREGGLADAEWMSAELGLPVLRDGLGWFACEASHECPAGDHAIVVGKVIGGEVMDAKAAPLAYRDTGDMDGASALYPDRLGN